MNDNLDHVKTINYAGFTIDIYESEGVIDYVIREAGEYWYDDTGFNGIAAAVVEAKQNIDAEIQSRSEGWS